MRCIIMCFFLIVPRWADAFPIPLDGNSPAAQLIDVEMEDDEKDAAYLRMVQEGCILLFFSLAANIVIISSLCASSPAAAPPSSRGASSCMHEGDMSQQKNKDASPADNSTEATGQKSPKRCTGADASSSSSSSGGKKLPKKKSKRKKVVPAETAEQQGGRGGDMKCCAKNMWEMLVLQPQDSSVFSGSHCLSNNSSSSRSCFQGTGMAGGNQQQQQQLETALSLSAASDNFFRQCTY